MTRRQWGGILSVALVSVALTACSAEVEGGPEIVNDIDVTTEIEAAHATLPPGAQAVSAIAVDGIPRAVDDVFVGTLFPSEARSDLAIVAFDATGTRWSLSTNPSCAGWSSTRASDGTSIVVALNSDARVEDGVLAENTLASGFDAATGSELWSAKPVIGPILGNGVLFNGAPKAILSAEPADTQTLTSDDGSALEAPEGWSNARVVHEHGGVVLLSTDGRVAAVDAVSGTLIWEGQEPGDFMPESSAGHALVFQSDSDPDQVSVVNLSTGELIAESMHELQAAPSADGSQTVLTMHNVSEPIVTLIGDAGTHWSRRLPAEESVRAVSIGAGHIYLTATGTGIVLASRDGAELQRGSFTVPSTVTTNGYGLIPTENPRVHEIVRLDAE